MYVLLFALFSNLTYVHASEEDTPTILNLDEEDFTNGSLVISHAFYKNFSTPYPLIDKVEFNNGLTVMGKYENISFGSFTVNTDLQDRVSLRFNDNKKMFSKGSKLSIDITNIRNYIEETDSTRHYWSTKSYRYTRVYFRDISGEYQHINNHNSDILKFNGGGFYSLSLEVEETPFDVYEIYFETVYKFDSYQDTDNLIGTSNRFHRFGGFSDTKISIVETAPDETKGLLGSIIEWIKSIYQGIVDLPGKIANLFSEMFNWVLNAITSLGNFLGDCISNLGTFLIEGIKSLFVPSDEDFSDLSDKWDTLLHDRFGAIYESVDIVHDTYSTIITGSSGGGGSSSIRFPKTTINLSGTDFSFGGWNVDLVPDRFSFLVDSIKLIVNIVCTLLFVNGLKKRFENIVGGGTE